METLMMNESLKQIGSPVKPFRSRWGGILSRRIFATLVFAVTLGGCGGANNSDGLGSSKPYFHTSYSGMLSNKEPDEGTIPSGGRT